MLSAVAVFALAFAPKPTDVLTSGDTCDPNGTNCSTSELKRLGTHGGEIVPVVQAMASAFQPVFPLDVDDPQRMTHDDRRGAVTYVTTLPWIPPGMDLSEPWVAAILAVGANPDIDQTVLNAIKADGLPAAFQFSIVNGELTGKTSDDVNALAGFVQHVSSYQNLGYFALCLTLPPGIYHAAVTPTSGLGKPLGNADFVVPDGDPSKRVGDLDKRLSAFYGKDGKGSYDSLMAMLNLPTVTYKSQELQEAVQRTKAARSGNYVRELTKRSAGELALAKGLNGSDVEVDQVKQRLALMKTINAIQKNETGPTIATLAWSYFRSKYPAPSGQKIRTVTKQSVESEIGTLADYASFCSLPDHLNPAFEAQLRRVFGSTKASTVRSMTDGKCLEFGELGESPEFMTLLERNLMADTGSEVSEAGILEDFLQEGWFAHPGNAGGAMTVAEQGASIVYSQEDAGLSGSIDRVGSIIDNLVDAEDSILDGTDRGIENGLSELLEYSIEDEIAVANDPSLIANDVSRSVSMSEMSHDARIAEVVNPEIEKIVRAAGDEMEKASMSTVVEAVERSGAEAVEQAGAEAAMSALGRAAFMALGATVFIADVAAAVWAVVDSAIGVYHAIEDKIQGDIDFCDDVKEKILATEPSQRHKVWGTLDRDSTMCGFAKEQGACKIKWNGKDICVNGYSSPPMWWAMSIRDRVGRWGAFDARYNELGYHSPSDPEPFRKPSFADVATTPLNLRHAVWDAASASEGVQCSKLDYCRRHNPNACRCHPNDPNSAWDCEVWGCKQDAMVDIGYQRLPCQEMHQDQVLEQYCRPWVDTIGDMPCDLVWIDLPSQVVPSVSTCLTENQLKKLGKDLSHKMDDPSCTPPRLGGCRTGEFFGSDEFPSCTKPYSYALPEVKERTNGPGLYPDIACSKDEQCSQSKTCGYFSDRQQCCPTEHWKAQFRFPRVDGMCLYIPADKECAYDWQCQSNRCTNNKCEAGCGPGP